MDTGEAPAAKHKGNYVMLWGRVPPEQLYWHEAPEGPSWLSLEEALLLAEEISLDADVSRYSGSHYQLAQDRFDLDSFFSPWSK